MKVRADVADMLRSGRSQADIVRTLHVSYLTVRATREALGLATHKPGPAPAESVEALFWRRAQPAEDGHLLWPGYDTCLRIADGPRHSAARVAFRIRYGRDPVGKALPGCDTPRCVAPDHVEDRPMRDHNRTLYAAIFGGTR